MKKFLLSAGLLLIIIGASGQCCLDGGTAGGCVGFNAILVDPNSATNNFDTDGDGSADTDDEFWEICNTGTSTVNIGGWVFADDDGTVNDYVFPGGTTLAPGECIFLINDWDAPPAIPAGNWVDLNFGSTGIAGNSGDNFFLYDPNNAEHCELVYGSASCGNTDPPVNASTSQGCDDVPEQDGCPTIWNGSSFQVDCNNNGSLLPVELISFEASVQLDKIQLHWITASESNNSHFILERSKNGEDFDDLVYVTGLGTTSETSFYSEIDFNPLPGISYYRLKQVDFDGSFEYSNVTAVVFNDIGFEIGTIQYTEESVDVRVISDESYDYNVNVLDAGGRTVYSFNSTADILSIPRSELASGVYILSVSNGYSRVTEKLIAY